MAPLKLLCVLLIAAMAVGTLHVRLKARNDVEPKNHERSEGGLKAKSMSKKEKTSRGGSTKNTESQRAKMNSAIEQKGSNEDQVPSSPDRPYAMMKCGYRGHDSQLISIGTFRVPIQMPTPEANQKQGNGAQRLGKVKKDERIAASSHQLKGGMNGQEPTDRTQHEVDPLKEDVVTVTQKSSNKQPDEKDPMPSNPEDDQLNDLHDSRIKRDITFESLTFNGHAASVAQKEPQEYKLPFSEKEALNVEAKDGFSQMLGEVADILTESEGQDGEENELRNPEITLVVESLQHSPLQPEKWDWGQFIAPKDNRNGPLTHLDSEVEPKPILSGKFAKKTLSTEVNGAIGDEGSIGMAMELVQIGSEFVLKLFDEETLQVLEPKQNANDASIVNPVDDPSAHHHDEEAEDPYMGLDDEEKTVQVLLDAADNEKHLLDMLEYLRLFLPGVSAKLKDLIDDRQKILLELEEAAEHAARLLLGPPPIDELTEAVEELLRYVKETPITMEPAGELEMAFESYSDVESEEDFDYYEYSYVDFVPPKRFGEIPIHGDAQGKLDPETISILGIEVSKPTTYFTDVVAGAFLGATFCIVVFFIWTAVSTNHGHHENIRRVPGRRGRHGRHGRSRLLP